MQNGKERQVYSYKMLLNAEKCFSVDECGFMMRKDKFMEYRFADLGPTWHLYSVDLCMRIQMRGESVGVIPVEAWHCSLGNLNSDYYFRMRKLAKKYKKYFSSINTTVITVDLTDPLWSFYLAKRQIHLMLYEKGILKK